MYRRRRVSVMRGRGRRRRQRGRGFFDSIGNFFKNAGNAIYDKAIRPVGNFIKDQRLISRAANLAGSVLPGPAGTAAKLAGGVAGQLGLGRRRRRRVSGHRRMRGGRRRRTGRRRQRGGSGPPGGMPLDNGLGLVSVMPPGGSYWPAGDRAMAAAMQNAPVARPNIFRRAWNTVKDARLISRGLRGVGLGRLADKAAQYGLGRRRRRTGIPRTVQRGRGLGYDNTGGSGVVMF